MKRLFILFYVFVLVIGCGSEGDHHENTGENNIPEISNLRMSRTSAQIGEGAGAVEVTATIDFTDGNGDVLLAHFRWRECGIGDWLDYDIPIPGLFGETSGTNPFIMQVDTVSCPPMTNDTIQISLFDVEGNQSNILNASFTLFQ